MEDLSRTGFLREWDPQQRVVLLCVVMGLAFGSGSALRGDGVAALRTGDPSCPDDSGDIYVDCGNGTVTDNRTGLIWLAQAGCIEAPDWFTAVGFAAGLSDIPASSSFAVDDCGLSDGSSAGEWRLPSIEEWEAMVANALGEGGDPDCTLIPPTITNDTGTGCLVSGPTSFSGVLSSNYWSSSTDTFNPSNAWRLTLATGSSASGAKTSNFFVWPVRNGQ